MLLQSFLLLLACYTNILTSSDHHTPQKKRERSHSSERLQATPSLQRTDVVAHSDSDDNEDSYLSPTHAHTRPCDTETSISHRELYARDRILLAECNAFELLLLDHILSNMIFPQLLNQEEPFKSLWRNTLTTWIQGRDTIEDDALLEEELLMKEKNKIKTIYAFSMYQRNIIQKHQAALAAKPTPVIQNNTFWLYNPFLPKD